MVHSPCGRIVLGLLTKWDTESSEQQKSMQTKQKFVFLEITKNTQKLAESSTCVCFMKLKSICVHLDYAHTKSKS